jgi:hypothetical protein
MTDIRPLKNRAMKGEEPIRTLILSLPDDIDRTDLVNKMDVILQLLDNKKEVQN